MVRIADEFTDLDRGRWLAMQACLVLALVQLDRYAGASRRDADGPGARTLEHARRFRRQVEDWFCERRPLEDYTQALAITPTQLNRICRAAFGRSALQVIHGRLLLEAQHELVHSPAGVGEIGYDLGFDDPMYFTRFFTKRVGMFAARLPRASPAATASRPFSPCTARRRSGGRHQPRPRSEGGSEPGCTRDQLI